MYNQSMMFTNPWNDQVPYCPFIRSMYMTPNMMRSEELGDELDATSTEIIDNSNSDSREDVEDNIIEECNESNDENESREDKTNSQLEEDIDYDDNLFRFPANPDRILRMIERNNPMVIRRLVMSGVPYPIALNMVRRIIVLTLQYNR